ncbi:endothelin-converting enzyme 1-like isoform X1 [Physella acuta]|uniref:endothelin-converting enzyme 1-like isoform X1 n=1 Tax=Physella acuta TaxID=109671 RepID=UPI0027DAF32B|nr:endothelin-converting enzyme 1-like isoform X1 [Physella acuta]
MANSYDLNDKEPIIKFIRIKRWKFRLREIILGVIALLLLLICFILSGLFNKVSNELAASTSQAYLDERMCVDIGCMETATRAMELRNKSVDPCENFYEYACGNYQSVAPVYLDSDSTQLLRMSRVAPLSDNSYSFARSVLEDLTRQNEDRMMDLLDSPISDAHDASYERKLKQYFQACNNMFDRDTKRGAPLLKIISELGGWKLLGNWKQDWNFNDALKKVQADFGVRAMFRVIVEKQSSNSNKFNIAIYPSGTSQFGFRLVYLSKEGRKSYKTYIRRVGSLLVNDAITMNITQDNGTTELDLDEFVNDTFAIESHLASAMLGHQDRIQTNLTALNAESHGLMDWVQQLGNLLGTANITGDQEVILFNRTFTEKITSWLTSFPVHEMNRMLHNYLIWRVAESFGLSVSSNYIHLFKENLVKLRIPLTVQPRTICILTAISVFQDGLSALYVRHFFNEENKRTVHEITDNIKLALQSQLEKTPWMDATTKQYAKEKLDKTIFKMGYPDWMKNQSQVDHMYSGLNISDSDHFANLLSVQRFRLRRTIKQLNNERVRFDNAYGATFKTMVYAMPQVNEVYATAGVLQYPIYSSNQPHHSTFGSLGAILGQVIVQIIDFGGSRYDQTTAAWWTEASIAAYDTVSKCVSNVSKTQDSLELKGHIDRTSGVRLALIGYKDWVKSRGIVEKVLPGTGLTNEQMIFLAFAQTFCYVKEDLPDRKLMYFSGNDVNVNMALGQLKEFSKAFNCKPEAKMNHEVKCGCY